MAAGQRCVAMMGHDGARVAQLWWDCSGEGGGHMFGGMVKMTETSLDTEHSEH